MYRDRDMNRISKNLSRVLATPRKGGVRRPRRRTQNFTGRPQRSRRALGGRVRFSRLRRPRTISNPAWGRSLPAAYASHVRPRFNVFSRTATSARVSGCDLVYPIPDSIATDGSYIFAVIPANPAYWTGTRIAQFAPAYMNYRPLSMTFSYIPQVAVTQAGTVFMGTVWNGAAPATNVQQTLVTSNGGCLTQCYVPCDTTINLGSNLQQNLFTLSGALDPDSSPFLFLAGVRGSDVVPGYFYVSYTYEFKNPIGQAWDYGRSAVLTGSSIPTQSTHPNSSLVLLSQSGPYGPGTIFDLESDGTYYHGSPVTIETAAYVIEFYNQQSGELPDVQPSLLISKVGVTHETQTEEIPLEEMIYSSSTSPLTGTNLIIHSLEGDNLGFFTQEAGTVGPAAWYHPLVNKGTWITLKSQDDTNVASGLAPIQIDSSFVDVNRLSRLEKLDISKT